MKSEKKSPGYFERFMFTFLIFILIYFSKTHFLHSANWYMELKQNFSFLVDFLELILNAVLSGIMGFVMFIPETIPFVRRKYMEVTYIEGAWIEILNNDIHDKKISVCKIYYNFAKKRHSYKGFSYNSKGEEIASWEANHVSYIRNHGTFQITFLGTGDKILEKKRIIVNTSGIINFRNHTGHDDNYDSGSGYYVDFNEFNFGPPDLEQVSFEIVKVPKDVLKSPKQLKNKDDYLGVAIKYLNSMD